MHDHLLSQTRWFAASPPMTFQLPDAQVRDVLLHPGSLTRRLQRESGDGLQVRILREGADRPTLSEARILGLEPRRLAWVREILLCTGDSAWIKARTLFPLDVSHSASRRFRHLGHKPLGTVLFREPGWRRSAFRVGWVASEQSGAITWARRSTFSRQGEQLLITEWFFPAYWHHQPATFQRPEGHVEETPTTGLPAFRRPTMMADT